MHLSEYLKIRINGSGKSGGWPGLTYKEAGAIGIPWPLPRGWIRAFPNHEIPEHLIEAARNGQSFCLPKIIDNGPSEHQRASSVAFDLKLSKRKESKAARKAAAAIKRAARRGRSQSRATERIPAPSQIQAPSYYASDNFLSSYEWRVVRMKALKRDGARCACCGATPATGAVMNVDHIKPRRKYPELALSLDNLQVLCAACNHGKGNWDETDWRMSSEEKADAKAHKHMLKILGMESTQF